MGFGDLQSFQENYANISTVDNISYLVYGNGYLYASSSITNAGIYKISLDYSTSVTPEK
jgi:hypothetical protein